MNDITSVSKQEEPIVKIKVGDNTTLTLLGTAHVSRASQDKVFELLQSGEFDAVAVELCPSRHHALLNPDVMDKMDLFSVIREGKVAMVLVSLALSAYQQRMAEQFGIEPGADMRAAVNFAQQNQLPVLLVDREVGITLKRIQASVSWWQRINLSMGLFVSVITDEKVSEDEIENLKQGDVLESTFNQFFEQAKELYVPLIQERDHYMAAILRQEIANEHYQNILVIVGAGHLKGIQKYLAQQTPNNVAQLIESLEAIPKKKTAWRFLPWLIVGLILLGFIIGFSRNHDLGWQLVQDWIVINGSLSALGALLAGGHILTVLTAFVAAPITSLNPMIGAGMVSAFAELFLRKPKVGDFSHLRKDIAHLRGWWKNRVSRTLLVFFFSSIGSAIGTYIAGFLIFERLVK